MRDQQHSPWCVLELLPRVQLWPESAGLPAEPAPQTPVLEAPGQLGRALPAPPLALRLPCRPRRRQRPWRRSCDPASPAHRTAAQALRLLPLAQPAQGVPVTAVALRLTRPTPGPAPALALAGLVVPMSFITPAVWLRSLASRLGWHWEKRRAARTMTTTNKTRGTSSCGDKVRSGSRRIQTSAPTALPP